MNSGAATDPLRRRPEAIARGLRRAAAAGDRPVGFPGTDDLGRWPPRADRRGRRFSDRGRPNARLDARKLAGEQRADRASDASWTAAFVARSGASPRTTAREGRSRDGEEAAAWDFTGRPQRQRAIGAAGRCVRARDASGRLGPRRVPPRRRPSQKTIRHPGSRCALRGDCRPPRPHRSSAKLVSSQPSRAITHHPSREGRLEDHSNPRNARFVPRSFSSESSALATSRHASAPSPCQAQELHGVCARSAFKVSRHSLTKRATELAVDAGSLGCRPRAPWPSIRGGVVPSRPLHCFHRHRRTSSSTTV
jgi:hypothetical protein